MTERAEEPDILRARTLAGLLGALADRLELPDDVLAEQIDRRHGDPHELAKVRKREARALIGRLHDAWLRLDADNVEALKGQRREALLSACSAASASLRHVRRGPRKPGLREGDPATTMPAAVFDGALQSGFENAAIQIAVDLYANAVEEHRELVLKHADLVRDLVRAYARIDGARKVAEAAEDLFDAMGYPANYASVKRVRRRRRNPR